MKENRYSVRRFCAAFLMLCLLTSLLFINSPVVKAEENDEPYIVVSLGDSYGSGEGVEPFYYQDLPYSQKVNKEDWIAHRSEKSWSGKLQMPYLEKPLSAYKDKYWFFEANSGAKTAEVVGGEALANLPEDKNSNIKKYIITRTDPHITGTTYLPAQIEIFDQLEKGSVRYVTISIGGNDAGFSTVMKNVILGSIYLNYNNVETLINQYYENNYQKLEKIKETLKDTYRKISEAAGPQATILVAGYPYLLEQYGRGAAVSKKEAECVNEAVRTFNNMLYFAVKECHDDDQLNIEFVPVAEDFEGHEAFSKIPYLNDLIMPPRSEDYDQTEDYSCYSFHPNEKGTDVYAECFQKVIDKLEKDREQPVLLKDSVDWFLNKYVSTLFYDEKTIVGHGPGYDTWQTMYSFSKLYKVLHGEDSVQYPLENINLGFADSVPPLSEADIIRAREESKYQWIEDGIYYRYDAKGTADVLDKLFGKGKMPLERFFGDYGFITSDGLLLLYTAGTTPYHYRDYCRYKIQDIEKNGDEIKVTASCVIINCENRDYDGGDKYFNSPYNADWGVDPVYGTYFVYDVIARVFLEHGQNPDLMEDSDYERFADEYDITGLNAETVVIYLYKDEDGVHLK